MYLLIDKMSQSTSAFQYKICTFGFLLIQTRCLPPCFITDVGSNGKDCDLDTLFDFVLGDGGTTQQELYTQRQALSYIKPRFA